MKTIQNNADILQRSELINYINRQKQDIKIRRNRLMSNQVVDLSLNRHDLNMISYRKALIWLKSQRFNYIETLA